MLTSAVELLASGSELHCTSSHICQLDLLGNADYIVFVDRICNVCANQLKYTSHIRVVRKLSSCFDKLLFLELIFSIQILGCTDVQMYDLGCQKQFTFDSLSQIFITIFCTGLPILNIKRKKGRKASYCVFYKYEVFKVTGEYMFANGFRKTKKCNNEIIPEILKMFCC